MTWLFVGCATAAGFTLGLLLGAGNGWAGVLGGVVAGVVTFAVRRPRRMARLGDLLDTGEPEDPSGWDRMRQREIVRRRILAARASTAGTPAGVAAGRRRLLVARWRRRHPPHGVGADADADL